MRPPEPCVLPKTGTRPALANERTALGWQRSSLSLAAIAALLLVHAVDRGEPAGVAAAVLVGLGAGWMGAVGRRLYRGRTEARQGPATRALLGVLLVTLLAAATAVGELLGGT